MVNVVVKSAHWRSTCHGCFRPNAAATRDSIVRTVATTDSVPRRKAVFVDALTASQSAGWRIRTRLRSMEQVMRSPLRTLVEDHRDAIKAIVARHKGTSVALFGSVARGQEHPDSDVDLLVDFGPGASLFDLVDIEFAVEELLGRPVDVMSRGALNERDDDIRRDSVPL